MDRPSYLESDAVRAAKSLGEGEDRWSTARDIRQAIAAGRICVSVFVALYHRKYAIVSTDTASTRHLAFASPKRYASFSYQRRYGRP